MKDWLRSTGGQVLGWILTIGGIALLVLPGPGLVVLAAGVALLAPHYEWAQRIVGPLRKRAVKAAKEGVSTKPRIAVTTAGCLWLAGLGVLWLKSPTFPPFSVIGWQVGPQLPGGMAAGIGLLISGALAAGILVYSIKRWYPGGGKGRG